MAQDNYIVGNGRAPEWCRRYLTPYKKANGTTGYEFYAKFRTLELEKGDVLEMKAGNIWVKRTGRE